MFQLLTELSKAMKPNKVQVQSLPMNKMLTTEEEEFVKSLFVSVSVYSEVFQPAGGRQNIAL